MFNTGTSQQELSEDDAVIPNKWQHIVPAQVKLKDKV
jgi:hypothetical protein